MKETKVTFYNTNSKKIILTCEIAESYSEKMRGLMYRPSLPDDRGMLFPFLFPGNRLIWMKNVNFPLDLIFVNRKLEIIWIKEADIDRGIFNKIYWSHGFCKYIIETNKGFCKKFSIKKGDKIKIKKRENKLLD